GQTREPGRDRKNTCNFPDAIAFRRTSGPTKNTNEPASVAPVVNGSVHVVAHSSAIGALWIKPTQQADQVARLDQIGLRPRDLGLGPFVGLIIGRIGDESDAGAGSSTQTAGHAESIATGQAQINDGHVVWTGNAKANALRAGSRCVDLMAKPRQQETKRLEAVGIIFDD